MVETNLGRRVEGPIEKSLPAYDPKIEQDAAYAIRSAALEVPQFIEALSSLDSQSEEYLAFMDPKTPLDPETVLRRLVGEDAFAQNLDLLEEAIAEDRAKIDDAEVSRANPTAFMANLNSDERVDSWFAQVRKIPVRA